MMNNIPYLLALHSIDGLGPVRLRAVLEYFKDPKLAWEASAGELLRIGVYKKIVDLLLETRKKLEPESYARKITGYGSVATERFTKGLVAGGLTIVSGLARGVDSQAHLTAVSENGKTIAVLGGGLNNIFPPENRGLAAKIANGFGAVMSEFPPNYASLPGNFHARNRIISGLSLAVLVI